MKAELTAWSELLNMRKAFAEQMLVSVGREIQAGKLRIRVRFLKKKVQNHQNTFEATFTTVLTVISNAPKNPKIRKKL